MEKIGILGGTFNPVHNEHIVIAKNAVKELNLDKLIIMPTFSPPHKSALPISGEDRIKMLEIAFSGEDKIEISDYEIKKGGTSYTYSTVEHFQNTNPCRLFFICGGDMLVNFKTWRYPERILASCELAVFDRDDFFTDYDAERKYFREKFNKDFIKLNYEGKSVSSTKIRTYSAFDLSLEGLVPKGVEEYIKKNNIYGGDFYADFIKANLPLKRIKHTADVVVCALYKAKSLGLNEEKVKLSATLHDCAKYMDYKAISGFTLPLGVPKPVVHSFLGAYVAEKFLGVTDEEVLDAIRYHTSGKANMSLLAKLVFVADMIEEGRTYEGVDALRKLYEEKDFDECFRECLKEEYLHLKNKKEDIYVQTINAYNYYIKENKE